MSDIEPNAGFELAAAGNSGGSHKRSWRTILSSILAVATGTVVVGLGLFYLLVSSPH